ncbi:MAG: molybdopterin-guanine dinucleotide biosynthesis protein B [Lachnospiraceae bacterium]|nr:molybdopterin-guanine dinucleotide biosynthesis protein B [Lachnospiraceae bacterium]
MGIPVIGFAAFSGTGKTTLIEKLIPVLVSRGLKVAVVKHDAHGLKFDHEGKDSARFSDAGAAYSIVSGPDRAAVFIDKPLQPENAFRFAHDADLIIVEGYKQGNFTQIGISRNATGKGFTAPLSRFIAVVTDEEIQGDTPVFGFDDIEKIADFIIVNMDSFTRC